MSQQLPDPANRDSIVGRFLRSTLENRLVVVIFTLLLLVYGIRFAPFEWDLPFIEQDPIPVDAIPDYGENQQIVFTEWTGRSPRDVEDQITYPLTSALLGLPEVKSIRSASMGGFSSINIIFNDGVDFYWSRSRVLEKLNSLPSGTLPPDITPQLGPDSTGLGQVFWYTLEGWTLPNAANPAQPAGGWNLEELRSVQDWYVRYALQGVEGVSEVASIGGYVKEYQIDINPDALRAYDITIFDIAEAAKAANVETGAKTIEINRVDYQVRGLGYIKSLDDLRKAVVKNIDGTPVTLDQVATVQFGPAYRNGVLDKDGAEAVGGVVVARYGENPLSVINRVKEKIEEISAGLPQKELTNGDISKVRIVPFYDRSGLIKETIGTLESAINQQILVTIIVVIMLVLHLRSALIITSTLPLAVLFAFIGMKLAGVDANIVALSGIAIAIGTIVDIGIVLCENVLEHVEKAKQEEHKTGHPYDSLEVTLTACKEVGGAVLTAVLTTVVSFLPVFAMEGAEGKLFKPLAYTKTLALIGSIVVGLTLLPPLAMAFISRRPSSSSFRKLIWTCLSVFVFALCIYFEMVPIALGVFVLALALYHFYEDRLPSRYQVVTRWVSSVIVALVVGIYLALDWQPLGEGMDVANSLFVITLVGGLIFFMYAVIKLYPLILAVLLNFKKTFLAFVSLVILLGALVWLGFGTVFGFIPESWRQNKAWSVAYHAFPGLGKEFMPSFDEGSYLLMPITSPHASITEAKEQMQQMDLRVASIPEVESIIGKIGRAETPLDPAPISMFETIVNYKSEYKLDSRGRPQKYAYDSKTESFLLDDQGELIPDKNGRLYRQWRDHIRSRKDIWEEIAEAAQIPGVSPASELQPIETRITMLQTGMRAPVGLKVYAPDLQTVQELSLQLRDILAEIPAIESESVIAPRIMGKPYLEIQPDRQALAQYGMSVGQLNTTLEAAVGGVNISQSVEGRERYAIRLRYQRERRDNIEAIGNILIPTGLTEGGHIPLRMVADINYQTGPDEILSENTFPVVYVTFETTKDVSELDAVAQAQQVISKKIASGELVIPAGASLKFAGEYENQVRAEKKLALILPITLLLIFLIIYLQFRKVSLTLMVFSGVFVAWSGGFILIWLFNQGWFLNFEVWNVNLRSIFQIHTINLSIAIWVGFLALFGIATDDGVLMGTYLEQKFPKGNKHSTPGEIRRAVVAGAQKRVRPAMMTSATTILALLPVLTSTGKGAGVMVPMAIPTFGGMLFAILTIYVVPVLYCGWEELKLNQK